MVQPTPIRPAKPMIPSHLAPEEAELYAQITRAYGIKDEAAQKILEEGLRSLGRAVTMLATASAGKN